MSMPQWWWRQHWMQVDSINLFGNLYSATALMGWWVVSPSDGRYWRTGAKSVWQVVRSRWLSWDWGWKNKAWDIFVPIFVFLRWKRNRGSCKQMIIPNGGVERAASCCTISVVCELLSYVWDSKIKPLRIIKACRDNRLLMKHYAFR